MKRTLISDLRSSVGKTVKVDGWVEAVRDQKTMQFVILRDHTGLVQVALERSKQNGQLNDVVASLNVESAVEILGDVIEDARVNLGGIEIRLAELQVKAAAPEEFPIDISGKTQTGLDKRLDWRFLDLRRPGALLVFKIQTTVEMAMRQYWVSQGFIEIHTPKFMGSASETGAELFEVKYFDRTAYLAQSPQFYKQMAMAAGFDRVFEIGPVFRANPSFTARHDTEFTSVDAEMSWIDSHEDVMQFEELWLQHVVRTVKDKHGEDIFRTYGTELKVPELPFPRITMREAKNMLGKLGLTLPNKGDLDREAELALANHVMKETNHEFMFLTDYPATVRPFYHMRYEDAPSVTKGFDLFWKGLEVTTGSQREHRYDVLVHQAEEKGIDLEPIRYYLDFFRYGCPPHGGYGFGLTRMLTVMLELGNVREVTFVPRDPGRLYP